MRSAAKDFTNTLLDSSIGPGSISIGVVPWASTVNINSERPGRFDLSPEAGSNVNAAGSRRVPNAAFEDRTRYLLAPQEEINYTTEAMENDFGLVDWRGCIRTAPDERVVLSSGSVLNSLTDAPVPGMRWHVNFVAPHLSSIAGYSDRRVKTSHCRTPDVIEHFEYVCVHHAVTPSGPV